MIVERPEAYRYDVEKRPEFPYSEYKARLEKARILMEKHGIDGLLLFCHLNWTYYTGYRSPGVPGTSNFLIGAVVPRDGETAFVAPNEVYDAVRMYSWVDDVKFWLEEPKAHPIGLMIEVIKELGLENKTIGVEWGLGMGIEGVNYLEFEAIKKGLPDAKFVDATDMIWEQRKIKTPWEIKTYRKLARIAARGYKAGLEFVKKGVTEREVHEIIWKKCISEGAHDAPMLGMIIVCAYPPGKAYPRFVVRPSDYRLKRGDQLMLDGGPHYKGYSSDFQRQACIGEASDLIKKLHRQSIVGIEAAEEILKPGIKASDLYKIPWKAMKKYNPEAQCPWTFMGHGEGMRNHELPYLAENDHTILEPGMIIAVETPGMDPPRWRVLGGYVEDIYLITEDGYENLTEECPRELWIR